MNNHIIISNNLSSIFPINPITFNLNICHLVFFQILLFEYISLYYIVHNTESTYLYKLLRLGIIIKYYLHLLLLFMQYNILKILFYTF